jgi:hypothetical protein
MKQLQDRHLLRRALTLPLVGLALVFAVVEARTPFGISDDRDLKEIDLRAWDCLNKLEGTAKTPDGVERNRLKNRSASAVPSSAPAPLDTAGFLKRLANFDAQTKGKRRKELSGAQKQQLDALEKQVVQLTGYLVLAYCGPSESTNCGSVDFHDWHLEVFEKPQEHPPQPGDPTPIICEITPRTQNAIYRDNISIQELTAFFRRTDLEMEPTGHKAQKIRLTGYLLWDDDHNGSNDVGTTIKRVGANKYHNPWRSTAWELHPVFKIERADTPTAQSPATPMTPSEPALEKTPVAAGAPVSVAAPRVAPTPPQFVTVLQPVKIKIPYGETTLPRGTKLPIVSRGGQNVVVRYMDGIYALPISSTDLR